MIQIVQVGERNIQEVYAFANTMATEPFVCPTERPFFPEDVLTITALCQKEKTPAFLAKAQDRPVGWCALSPARSASEGIVGHLSLAVLHDQRRQGIGRSLLETTLMSAWKNGMEKVRLIVFTDNTPAISLYKKMGFRIEGTAPVTPSDSLHAMSMIHTKDTMLCEL